MENSALPVPEAPVRLWLPGLGVTDLRVRKVVKAVKEYDHALNLARHEITGDWVIIIGEEGHPVWGFGKELPNPEDVQHILGKRDVKRNGRRILDQSRREAAKRKADEQYRISETDGVAAEHFEHAFRKQGAHPTPRIFLPGRGL